MNVLLLHYLKKSSLYKSFQMDYSISASILNNHDHPYVDVLQIFHKIAHPRFSPFRSKKHNLI